MPALQGDQNDFAVCVCWVAAAGFAVLKLGGSQNDSMLATFFGAIAPLLWLARKNRIRREDPE